MKILALFTCFLSLLFGNYSSADNTLQSFVKSSETEVGRIEQKRELERKISDASSPITNLDPKSTNAPKTPYYVGAIKQETDLMPTGPAHSQVKQLDGVPQIKVGDQPYNNARSSANAIMRKLAETTDAKFRDDKGALQNNIDPRNGVILYSTDNNFNLTTRGKGLAISGKTCFLGGCPSRSDSSSTH